MTQKTKKKTVKKPTKRETFITPMKSKTIKVKVAGDQVLMNNFPDETKQEITDGQAGSTKIRGKKKNRDIDKEILMAKHFTKRGKDGIPKSGFKAGMIGACQFVINDAIKAGMFKKVVRGTKILGEEILPLKFKKEDVLAHTIPPNTRFSPMYVNWSTELTIEFDENNISSQDIVQLLNYAGRYIGVGTWSPRAKCGGNYGTYKVV